MYYIGLDIHKKTISYCVKDTSGQIQREGTIPATRADLDGWMKILPRPWTVAMEASIFTGWVYDHLLPHAAQVKVAHPVMLRAIAAHRGVHMPGFFGFTLLASATLLPVLLLVGLVFFR